MTTKPERSAPTAMNVSGNGTATPDQRRLIVCSPNGQFLTQVDPAQISDILAQQGPLVWLDLQDPTAEDIALLREEFSFHPLAIEDATRQHERPKVETYDGYYFLIFYAVASDPVTAQIITRQMSLFIGAHYLVSVHAGPIDAISDTIRRWQHNEERLPATPGTLIYELLDALVDDYFPVIDQVVERVEQLEEQIFAQFRQETLQEVFALKRDLLQLRRHIAPERDVLNVLLRREVPVVDAQHVVYLQDVYDHVVRVTESIDTYRDLLSSAVDAFLSVQSNQLNQVVKALTVASIILMSVTLVAGIYGMNFTYMPELSWHYGYPFALGLMVLIAGGLIAFFRLRKWL